MENKELNIQMFADEENEIVEETTTITETTTSEELTPDSSIDIHPNEGESEVDDLEKFRPENVDKRPSKEELARRKKRGKRAIIATVTVVLLGGIGVWIAASSFTPPVLDVKKVEGNKITLSNNKEFDFASNGVKVTSQWFSSNRQLTFTINGGIFQGYSFRAWVQQSSVQQDVATIGVQDGWSFIDTTGATKTAKGFAINLATKQLGSLDENNVFTAAKDGGAIGTKLSTAITNASTI